MTDYADFVLLNESIEFARQVLMEARQSTDNARNPGARATFMLCEDEV